MHATEGSVKIIDMGQLQRRCRRWATMPKTCYSCIGIRTGLQCVARVLRNLTGYGARFTAAIARRAASCTTIGVTALPNPTTCSSRQPGAPPPGTSPGPTRIHRRSQCIGPRFRRLAAQFRQTTAPNNVAWQVHEHILSGCY